MVTMLMRFAMCGVDLQALGERTRNRDQKESYGTDEGDGHCPVPNAAVKPRARFCAGRF